MSDELEHNGDDEPDELTNEQRAERIKAARGRDETAAALDDAQLPSPAELEAMPDEQLLGFLPAELRDAIAAGEISSEVALAKVREAAGALEPEPADEPDPTSAAIAEAHAAYLEAVAIALGPEAEIRPCADCSGFGFNPVEIRDDPYTERCPDCGGEGVTKSGSRVESQRVRPCRTCHGNGWRERLDVAPQAPAAATVVPVLPPFTPAPAPLEPADNAPAGVIR